VILVINQTQFIIVNEKAVPNRTAFFYVAYIKTSLENVYQFHLHKLT